MSKVLRFVLQTILRKNNSDVIASPTFSTKTEMSGEAKKRLRELGYAFNSDGQLRKIDSVTKEITDAPFQFDVFGDDRKNHEHYELLAEQIPEIVYELLEDCGLKRIYVPDNVPQEETTFIFTQPEKLNRSKKLLVLIHGSGYVRAGQWARSLIMNNSLDHGTQIPYIKRAQELGYDILVMNANDNYRLIKGVHKTIPKLSSPSEHAKYVWKNFVMASEPESVFIVAHSYGGNLTMGLAEKYPTFFEENVAAVALTDSAHMDIPKKAFSVLKNISCNWVSSDKPLDTAVSGVETDIRRVSAGHIKHEWTSWSAFESVFKFLEEKYKEYEEKHNKKS